MVVADGIYQRPYADRHGAKMPLVIRLSVNLAPERATRRFQHQMEPAGQMGKIVLVAA